MHKHRNPRQRLSKQPSPDNHRPAELPPPESNIPGAFGILQEIIGRVDAMVYATERHFERFGWSCRDEVDDTENPVGHLAHLIAAAREASPSAVSAGQLIANELAKNGGAA
jgi:hypothetical protein